MKINVTNNLPNFQSNERTLDMSLQHQKNIDLDLTQTNIRKDSNAEKHKVQAAATKMNEFIEPIITDLKFVFHEDLNEYYVTVVNPLTDEIIREIPPKKMLDIYTAMTEYIGLLVDEKI